MITCSAQSHGSAHLLQGSTPPCLRTSPDSVANWTDDPESLEHIFYQCYTPPHRAQTTKTGRRITPQRCFHIRRECHHQGTQSLGGQDRRGEYTPHLRYGWSAPRDGVV